MGIDFSGKQVRFGTSPWQPVLLGRHGEYLLSLTAGMDVVPDPTKTTFELNIAEEVPGSHLYLQDFNQVENIFLANDQVLAANGIAEQPMKKNQLHTIELGLLAATRANTEFSGKSTVMVKAAPHTWPKQWACRWSASVSPPAGTSTSWNTNASSLNDNKKRCPTRSCWLRLANYGHRCKHLRVAPNHRKKPSSPAVNDTIVGTFSSASEST